MNIFWTNIFDFVLTLIIFRPDSMKKWIFKKNCPPLSAVDLLVPLKAPKIEIKFLEGNCSCKFALQELENIPFWKSVRGYTGPTFWIFHMFVYFHFIISTLIYFSKKNMTLCLIHFVFEPGEASVGGEVLHPPGVEPLLS